MNPTPDYIFARSQEVGEVGMETLDCRGFRYASDADIKA